MVSEETLVRERSKISGEPCLCIGGNGPFYPQPHDVHQRVSTAGQFGGDSDRIGVATGNDDDHAGAEITQFGGLAVGDNDDRQ